MGSRNWLHLHCAVYVIAMLAVVHYSMRSTLEQWEPMIMAGLIAWLLGYRPLYRFLAVLQGLAARWVVLLSIAVRVLTALGGMVSFVIAYNTPAMRVLSANWSLDLGVRSAVVVLGLGLAVMPAGAVPAWTPTAAKLRARAA